jgi:hypothetical protein
MNMMWRWLGSALTYIMWTLSENMGREAATGESFHINIILSMSDSSLGRVKPTDNDNYPTIWKSWMDFLIMMHTG